MSHPSSQVDISRFSELSDGDTTSLIELIQLYLTKTTEQFLDLEKAIKSESGQEIGRIAHSLVGANAMVGMTPLIEPLRKLEVAGEKLDLIEANALFVNLSGEFKRIRTSLQNTLNVLSKSKSV